VQQQLILLLALGIPFTLLAASAGGWFLASNALNPIARITRAADLISARDLHQRLNFELPNDEVGRLAATFDKMLARLEDAFERQRRFIADASHEMRTPLTILKGDVEVALNRPRSTAEYQETLEMVNDSADRLTAVVKELFLLARADNNQLPLQPERLNLAALLTRETSKLLPRAVKRGIALSLDSPDELFIEGEPAKLSRLFINLIDNAIKYSETGDEVRVTLNVEGGGFPDYSGLPPEYAGEVAQWLRLDVSSDGVVSNRSGVTVNPVSIGRDLNSECPRYEAFAQSVAGAGWTPDVNLFCLPYDYRFPPGANSFTRDLRELIERVGASSKVALACHSQGCLMVYHALRTEDPQWVADHVLLLFGLAGQFSGCSDCMRWAFQQGWSWDPANALASPVDPTWAGELALDLQPSVYSNAVLYRSGAKEYRAVDARQLLEDAGAVSMARATTRYSLNRQEWFIRGERGEPLPIPARFVFGVGVPTTVGYAFDAVPSRETTCTEPVCAGFLHAWI